MTSLGPPKMDTATRQRRALAKAHALGLQGDVRPDPLGRRNVYRVPSLSEPGVARIVVVNPSGRIWCSCPAGTTGAPCTHAAAVWLYRLERQSGASVLAVRPA